MPDATLTVALITEVFPDVDRARHLAGILNQARAKGAELALLPELPLDHWAPADRMPSDRDAEPPDGPRARCLAAAAQAAGIAVAGGAIVREPASDRRHNTALIHNAAGSLLLAYRKNHLPFEPGYWEAAHYEVADDLPHPTTALPLAAAVQICSDANRPAGALLASALGAEVVLHPRATPTATYPRWELVLRALAVTGSTWLVSVNRPRPEGDADIGGPSLVIAPTGEVVLRTTEPIATFALTRTAVAAARATYPGDLALRAELYRRGWAAVEPKPEQQLRHGTHHRCPMGS